MRLSDSNKNQLKKPQVFFLTFESGSKYIVELTICVIIRTKTNKMNIPILAANILTLLAFFVHTFMGDRELKILEPTSENYLKREKWTMVRSGWHWISFDLLFVSIGLAIINFTDYLESEKQLLQLVAIYFLGYGIVWLIVISISKKFPKSYLKLGQWILLWLISGLIFWGLQV